MYLVVAEGAPRLLIPTCLSNGSRGSIIRSCGGVVGPRQLLFDFRGAFWLILRLIGVFRVRRLSTLLLACRSKVSGGTW